MGPLLAGAQRIPCSGDYDRLALSRCIDQIERIRRKLVTRIVLSDAGGLIMLEREPFESSMQTDFTTDNLMIKAYERYTATIDDWRLGAGSYPTN